MTTFDPSAAAADFTDPSAGWATLAVQLRHLAEGEPDLVANAANASALLFHAVPDLNWAGFYFAKGGELVLGPFQGLPACLRIPFSKGVCGAAARERRTHLVRDVHAFPGHIACDARSRSELVVPLVKEGALVGVLDLDSPTPGRFTEADARGAESFAEALLDAIPAPAEAVR